jgi:ubiquinone/menaquinone biosynthesis C-methylase UbiE
MKKSEHQPMPYTCAKPLLNPLRHLIQSPKKLVKRLDPRSNYNILELGPGPGFFSPTLATSVPDGKLTLVDIQQEMLDMCKKRLEKRGIKNVEYIKADAKELPLNSGSMNIVVLIAMFGEVPEQDQCLKEIHRLLLSDGILSITESKIIDPDFIPIAELIELVNKNGYKNISEYNDLFQYTVNFSKIN